MLVPLLAESVTRGLRRSEGTSAVTRRELSLWALMGTLCMVVLGVGVLRFDARAIPVSQNLTRQLSTLEPGTVMFGDPRLTGWLIHDHPETRQLVDLRYELFDTSTIRQSRRALDGADGWQGWLTSHDAAVVLVHRDTGLARALANANNWHLTDQDTNYVLYARGWRSHTAYPSSESTRWKPTDSAMRSWGLPGETTTRSEFSASCRTVGR